MTRNKKIIIGIEIIIGLVLISGIAFVCWQYHQNSEFAKNIECQKLGRHYDPKINECADENYCLTYPDNYWCKLK